MLICEKCGKVIANTTPGERFSRCAACGINAEPPRMPEAGPAWVRKAGRQGGNLVGSGFLKAVISGEESLTAAPAAALSGKHISADSKPDAGAVPAAPANLLEQ